MQIEDIEAMLKDFSQEMIDTFKTNQKDFKALTVQKVFEIMYKRKIDPNLAKTKDFWGRIHSNMELFRVRVVDEIDNKLKANFTDKERLDYFFEYLDKNTDA
jgi:tRNA(Met) C34 N-acetyltransferase TmcA